MDILKELWNGKVTPCAIRFGSDEMNKNYVKDITKAEDEFTNGLTEEQQKQYEWINDKRMSYQSYLESEIFAHGFRLGAQIVFAVTEEK